MDLCPRSLASYDLLALSRLSKSMKRKGMLVVSHFGSLATDSSGIIVSGFERRNLVIVLYMAHVYSYTSFHLFQYRICVTLQFQDYVG